jgi:uncharacterized integral membrane protein
VIRGAGIAGVAVVLALVMLFSRWNGSERVTLDLGLWTFYRVPLVYVAFGGIFVGMVVMLLANLHADLRVRRFLRDRLEEEGREEQERIDRYQRDLFRPDPEETAFRSPLDQAPTRSTATRPQPEGAQAPPEPEGTHAPPEPGEVAGAPEDGEGAAGGPEHAGDGPEGAAEEKAGERMS